jgi:ribosomal protein S18 acetylase RimI-like enzyme
MGILIDSLHIDPACRGQGLGRHLLRSAIAELEAVHKARPMHLLVYEENFDARRLYDALKGEIVERLPRDTGRCGTALLFRYHWASSGSLGDALR